MSTELPDILKKILARKDEEIDARRRLVGIDDLRARAADASPSRGFIQAMKNKLDMEYLSGTTESIKETNMKDNS